MSCFCNIFPIGIAKYKGHGDEERICLRLSMIINLLHLFASFVFINILNLDIIGTALSLNLARLAGGVMAMYFLLYRKSPLRVRIKDLFAVNWDKITFLYRNLADQFTPSCRESHFHVPPQMLCVNTGFINKISFSFIIFSPQYTLSASVQPKTAKHLPSPSQSRNSV